MLGGLAPTGTTLLLAGSCVDGSGSSFGGSLTCGICTCLVDGCWTVPCACAEAGSPGLRLMSIASCAAALVKGPSHCDIKLRHFLNPHMTSYAISGLQGSAQPAVLLPLLPLLLLLLVKLDRALYVVATTVWVSLPVTSAPAAAASVCIT
jgi:hypothetical protein